MRLGKAWILIGILTVLICPCDGLPMDTCRMASICVWENNQYTCANKSVFACQGVEGTWRL